MFLAMKTKASQGFIYEAKGVTDDGQTFDVLHVEGDKLPQDIVGQFKRGPFKGKFYTKAAHKLARSIKDVSDSGRTIEAPPKRLQ